MKISTEQAAAAGNVQQTGKRTQATGDAFSDLLTKELGQTPPATGAPTVSALPDLYNLTAGGLATLGQTVASSQAPTEQPLMDQVEGVLDDWEKYASMLSGQAQDETGTQGLKGAYAQLERIKSSVSELKDQTRDNPDLARMVNDLEVMSETETVKLNRGDYLA